MTNDRVFKSNVSDDKVNHTGMNHTGMNHEKDFPFRKKSY